MVTDLLLFPPVHIQIDTFNMSRINMMQMRLDLASRVLVEIGLKTVENGASEREGLLVIDHGHQQKDDGRSWWL